MKRRNKTLSERCRNETGLVNLKDLVRVIAWGNKTRGEARRARCGCILAFDAVMDDCFHVAQQNDNMAAFKGFFGAARPGGEAQRFFRGGCGRGQQHLGSDCCTEHREKYPLHI